MAAEKMKKVWEILEANDFNQARLIPILQAIQDEYRYLPEEVLTFTATALGLSPAKVFGVVTFYSHFSLEPKGKYVIKVCDGTACHVKGSGKLIETIRKHLELGEKDRSTRDLMFTLETVSCLGACGLAPAVVVNDKIFGQVTEAGVREIIDNIKASEAVHVCS